MQGQDGRANRAMGEAQVECRKHMVQARRGWKHVCSEVMEAYVQGGDESTCAGR